eukprot:s2896_g6.t1
MVFLSSRTQPHLGLAGPFGSDLASWKRRLLRITRLIRAVRFMPIFRELRVMVRSILTLATQGHRDPSPMAPAQDLTAAKLRNCLMPLIWCIVLLGFFQWCFAVYFITVSSDHVQAMHYFPERYSHLDQTRSLCGHFGTNYVLFMSVSGGLDWGYASDIFIELESYYAAAGYLFYIALVALAVLNVVTAVFVEYAMKMAADDRDLVIQDTLAKRNKYMQDSGSYSRELPCWHHRRAKVFRSFVDAMLVFKEADADGSGSITYKEFLDHVEDERVQAFLNSMELDGIEAIRLFKLLDLDGSGSVEPDEFVHGCMCLKGMAKTMDLAILLREQRKAMQTWGSFMSYVDICLTQLLKEEGLGSGVDPMLLPETGIATPGERPTKNSALHPNHVALQHLRQIVAAAQLQLGKRRESLRTAKAAKEALGAKRNDSLLARALRDEGAALAVLEDYDEAITRLKDAASTAVSADDLATQASIKRFEADVHINRSNFKEALSAARDALEISERQGDKRNMARALETVSTAQGVLNNFQQAVKEAKECQDLYQEVGDPMGEERALELLAKLRAAEGNLEGALEAGLERLAVVRESGSPEKEADALHQA